MTKNTWEQQRTIKVDFVVDFSVQDKGVPWSRDHEEAIGGGRKGGNEE